MTTHQEETGNTFAFCIESTFFPFKEEVSFWSWEILSDKTTNWKPAIIKRGISQHSFQKTVAIHFWKWFTAKESLLAVEGALIFRRQPPLWEGSRNLRDGGHVARWPLITAPWITIHQDDAWWPISSCNSFGAQKPRGLHTLTTALLWCKRSEKSGRTAAGLSTCQRSATGEEPAYRYSLPVSISKRAYDISFGEKKWGGKQHRAEK